MTMMPGENQSGAGAMTGCDASTGTCQNCSLLQGSLEEYVAALLKLKEKIIDTDRMLSKYKEKCDELQKSQRDNSDLHNELDVVHLKLGPLEKRSADYEAIKTELEENKRALKVYQLQSEEIDTLRDEKNKALAVKVKLEEALKKAEDTVNSQNVKNAQLRSEKKILNDDLQKTQESLQSCQQAAEEADNLKIQNAKTLIIKSTLENQLLALEDVKLKKMHEIQGLQSKNRSLEESLSKTQENLVKLKKEFLKEKKCSSTQTEAEPQVDKAKVRMLLQELWHSVDPVFQMSEHLHLNGPTEKQHFTASPFKNFIVQPVVLTATEGTKLSPQKSKAKSLVQTTSSPCKSQRSDRKPGRKKKLSQCEETNQNVSTARQSFNQLSDGNSWRNSSDVSEILDLFCPLPAALSPVQFSNEQFDDNNKNDYDLHLSSLRKHLILNSKQSTSKSANVKKHSSSEDAGLISHMDKSPKSQVNTAMLGVAPVPGCKVRHDVMTESQGMELEEFGEMKDTLGVQPCAVGTSLQNGTKKESNILNSTESLAEDQNQPGQSQANLGIETQGILDIGVTRNGLDPERTDADFKCTNIDDKSLKVVFRVDADVAGDCSAKPPNEKEQETLLIRTDEDGRCLKSIRINGVSTVEPTTNEHTEESSDDDEFFSLKRKVRGNCLRPESVASVSFNTTEEPMDHGHEKTSENIEDNFQEPGTENVVGTLQVGDIMGSVCGSLLPVDVQVESVNHPQNVSENFTSEESLKGPQTSSALQEEKESQKLSHDVPPVEINKEESLSVSRNFDPAKDDSVTSKDENESLNPPIKYLPIKKTGSSPTSKDDLTEIFSESVGMESVRMEMGPPLPPAILPLSATPPRFGKHQTPNRPIRQLPWSSTEGSFSLTQQSISFPPSGPQEQAEMSPKLTTPSPTCGVPSSPLQFGSATPKHAVPVPGRLPSTTALNSSSPSTSQENSMQMLDTMYPELSAQARTLNILRGNLGRPSNETGPSPPSVNPISGNKTINSSSTAFTKTEQKQKRTGVNILLPKSAKRLRLDTCSPDSAAGGVTSQTQQSLPIDNKEQDNKIDVKGVDERSRLENAFEKLETSCFDMLPAIKSHVNLGRISQIPVLRDEEKEVIAEFFSNQSSGDEFLSAILTKIKVEREILKPEVLQSLCRVHIGICRQRLDWQKAHALAYNILKEDYPEAPKLILFMVTTWPSMLSHNSVLSQAVHTVSKLKAEGELLDYLSMYLHWKEKPPGDIYKLIKSTIKTLLENTDLKFQKHERYGDDLCPSAWEYIFSVDLLCAHLGWKWTHDNIVGKELWPVMNLWVTQPRNLQTPVRDVCIAAVLRLIGRLGQLGIKEKLRKSVENVAKAINLFCKHGIAEGVPWDVQLTAIYTAYDLAPSNPKEALEALASWRGETTQAVPSAITSCITQIGSLCRQIKP